MGAHCTGCTSVKKKHPEYSKQPLDIHEYFPEKLNYKLQKLNFEGQLENVQVANYPYELISIKFSINEVFQYSLPRLRKQSNQNSSSLSIENLNKIKWKFDQKFEFAMNEYEIRKSFIRISIFRQQLVPILQIKLNLYQIITGPYHHDLALIFGKDKQSRLIFDFKISQKFSILINPIDISVHLNQQYPGDQFNYSFNAYSCSQKVCTSDGSIPKKASIFSNVEGNYRQLKPQDQCESPTRIRKGTNLNKMIKNVMTSEINWSKQQEISTRYFLKQTHEILQEQMAMPSFKFALKSNHINKSSLQFVLWNIQINNASLNNQAIIFADCYIPIPKIFQSDCTVLEELQASNDGQRKDSKKLKKKIQSRITVIQDQLIKDGKLVGKVRIKFRIVNQVHFSQLYLYAKTEDGIVYMNSMFKTYAGKDRSKRTNINILKIEQIFQNIANLIFEYNQISKQSRRNWAEYNNLEEQIFKQFGLLQNTLTKTLQESLVLSQKHEIQEMIQNQNLILNMLERIQIFLQEENTKFVNQSWKLLIALVKRGELYLENIGFNEYERSNSSKVGIGSQSQSMSVHTSKIYNKKIETALKYQQILYKTLCLALDFNFQNQSDFINEVEAYKAYCYFRVPKFREQVLKCVIHEQDNSIIDDSLIDIYESEKKVANNVLKIQQKSSFHLNWEKYFYSFLKGQSKYKQLNTMMEQKFQNNQWLKYLAKRQQHFYTFIEYFSKKMAQVGKRLRLTRYSFCPGYNKLVKSFLVQMKKKPLIEYESTMIQTSTVLLANYNLINLIIPIIVQKTNLYDSASTNKFLNILSTYLKYLTDNGNKTLPEKFNHVYFFKIIKMILESQYSYGIAKMLVILHTYFQNFNEEFKEILSLYLLSKAFFRLFFHWSYNIRIIFYHIFIIKIYWSKLNGVTENENKLDTYRNQNQQIYQRYKKLIKILNTAERERHIIKKNMKRAEKQQYYVKMKKKLYKKKHQNPQTSLQLQEKLNYSGVDNSSSQFQSQKQRSMNLSRLENLSQLKNGFNRSQTLCSDQIKEHLKALKSSRGDIKYSVTQDQAKNKAIDKGSSTQARSDIDGYSINLKIKDSKRINQQMNRGDTETTVKQEIQKLNQDCVNLLPITHKKSFQDKPLIYSFFGNEDYQLEQMSLNQENKILMGMGQFRQTQQFVEKYILSKGVAPHVNLDPEIQIDSNEPRPQQLFYA